MYPIIALSISGLLTLFLGFLDNKKLVFPISILFLVIALGVSFVDWNAPGLYFSEMMAINNETIIFGAIILVSAILILCLSEGFNDIEFSQPAEYFALVQLSLVGALMMISFENLLMLFLGIEILSIGLYVLTGADKRNLRGNEAAIKYFLMGAFATGILLFGIAMFYGAVGSFNIHVSVIDDTYMPFFWIGCTLILIGLTFKISAAPFHFWSPDVYEGAPTIFTAYMATVVKTAGFVAIFKVLYSSFSTITEFWTPMIVIMVGASLIIGNVFAVTQDSFKRLMAYSSVSHAGFMLLALLGDNENALGTIMFYSVAYSLATITAFGVLMKVSKHRIEKGRPYEKNDLFEGLIKNNGFLTGVLAIALLSLAGIPLTAGFWGKFFVFRDAAASGNFVLIVIAVLMSAVAVYYYFKPIILSMKKTEGVETVILSPLVKLILALTTCGTIVLGIFPNLIRSIF
ncbi:NADH-quinone oxidoreductase subunit N [Arcticibacterium luteifluviistationis]|uniref:NADH-quinone oxidoreductase subunit N n=1 Tax=Arcticibacterium luteifluviistationis TaxID=1784714 RepID=A0A2Z4GEP4_9BACT|nr:NADH-quinone oxidoreductase subunit N [Arcticibacterium luteifluviistationis]AWV99458.1 NADH-quinone oxidoreductase subunit N [Arcticibacterium luteifluviistationis]